jgi:AcrR family transcriptional regulator
VRGPDGVSVDAIAAEAGVARGRLPPLRRPRRLLRAVLSEREAALQERLIRGERRRSGPAHRPLERLLAFGPAYLEFVAERRPCCCAESGGRRAVRRALPCCTPTFTSLLREARRRLDSDYSPTRCSQPRRRRSSCTTPRPRLIIARCASRGPGARGSPRGRLGGLARDAS